MPKSRPGSLIVGVYRFAFLSFAALNFAQRSFVAFEIFALAAADMRFFTDFRQITRKVEESVAEGRQARRKAEYNPAEVRSADFRDTQYSYGASACPDGSRHFNYGVFSATGFSDYVWFLDALRSLQGRNELLLAPKSLPTFSPSIRCVLG